MLLYISLKNDELSSVQLKYICSLVIMVNNLYIVACYPFAVTTASEKSYRVILKGRDFQNVSGIPSRMLSLPQGVKVMLTVRSKYITIRRHDVMMSDVNQLTTGRPSYLLLQISPTPKPP